MINNSKEKRTLKTAEHNNSTPKIISLMAKIISLMAMDWGPSDNGRKKVNSTKPPTYLPGSLVISQTPEQPAMPKQMPDDWGDALPRSSQNMSTAMMPDIPGSNGIRNYRPPAQYLSPRWPRRAINPTARTPVVKATATETRYQTSTEQERERGDNNRSVSQNDYNAHSRDNPASCPETPVTPSTEATREISITVKDTTKNNLKKKKLISVQTKDPQATQTGNQIDSTPPTIPHPQHQKEAIKGSVSP